MPAPRDPGGSGSGGYAVTRANEETAVRTVGRRSLLIFTAAAGLGLAGCTDSPLVPGPGPKPSQTPKPIPLPGTVDAAATEQKLADYADAVLTRHRANLDHGERELVSQLHTAHLAHLEVLTSTAPFDLPQPTPSSTVSGGPTSSTSGSPIPSGSSTVSGTPSPSATLSVSVSGSPAKAIAALAALEAAAAEEHRARALRPGGPEDQLADLALLWGSLATAADSYRSALTDHRDPAAAPTGQQRVAIALPDRADAATNLLEQCYAIIFGYQTALAKLSGGRADHARSTLSGYRDLRDRLVDELLANDQKLPAPHAGYKVPVQPTSSSSAGKLLGSMETAMLPFIGQWLATSDSRSVPVATMIHTARDVLAWTSTIMVWPGWPTQD